MTGWYAEPTKNETTTVPTWVHEVWRWGAHGPTEAVGKVIVPWSVVVAPCIGGVQGGGAVLRGAAVKEAATAAPRALAWSGSVWMSKTT